MRSSVSGLLFGSSEIPVGFPDDRADRVTEKVRHRRSQGDYAHFGNHRGPPDPGRLNQNGDRWRRHILPKLRESISTEKVRDCFFYICVVYFLSVFHFSPSATYYRHLKRHEDQKQGFPRPLVCPECPVTFKTKYALKIHAEKHSAPKSETDCLSTIRKPIVSYLSG